MKTKKGTVITLAKLKEERGWTQTMAKRLLANLDFILVDNPYYRCAAPMKLYNLSDIKKIERTKKFKALKEKAEKRKASAKKAVETKIQTTLYLVEDFSINVERIPIDDLREEAIESKQFWYDEHIFDYCNVRDAYSAPKDDVDRWMVNYIRHNLSNYDEELERLDNRVGKLEGYFYYKQKLKDEMKKVYPELVEEIDKYM